MRDTETTEVETTRTTQTDSSSNRLETRAATIVDLPLEVSTI